MRLALLVALAAASGCSTSVRLAPEPAQQEPVTDPCLGVDCGPDAVCSEGSCVPVEPDPCEGVPCFDGFVCVDGECVDTRTTCENGCGVGSVCVEGQCVDVRRDGDGDGYPRRSDCDDGDNNVYPGTVSECETDCGRGTKQCTGSGEWSPCSAPSECQCRPGDEHPEPCGRCARAIRYCGEDGRWDPDPPECHDDGGECRPELGVAAFVCGEGCGLVERECGQDCQWYDVGECRAVGEGCLPGDQMRGGDCGNCGHYTLTCTSECSWDEGGSCEGEGRCASGDASVQPCGPCDLGLGPSTCGLDCQWEEPVACVQPADACEPGTTRPADCGCQDAANAGNDVCGNDCTWDRPADACPCTCRIDGAAVSLCVGDVFEGGACDGGVERFSCDLDGEGGCTNSLDCVPAVL